MNILPLINRSEPLFEQDILSSNKEIKNVISKSRFLVIGGAGSIGQAVTSEIFRRDPRALHVVDISENNVELVSLRVPLVMEVVIFKPLLQIVGVWNLKRL